MKFEEALKHYREGKKIQNTRNGDFLDDYHSVAVSTLIEDDWEILEEPKPKVKRWLWASIDPDGRWIAGDVYLADEPTGGRKTSYKKLEYTMQEFDE